jgi:hypothetical protein
MRGGGYLMKERSLEPPTEARTRINIDHELECETCGNPPEVTETLDRDDDVTDRTHYCTTCQKSLTSFGLRPAGDFAKYQEQEVAQVG